MNIKKVFCCYTFLAFACLMYGGNPLKIDVVSDIHYLSPSFMDNGAAVQRYEKQSAKDIRDVPAILDQVLKNLESDRPDVLLIAGDLTKDGERQSHLDLKRQLDKLSALGVRIFVTPGNHDISVPHPVEYEGDQTLPVDNISPQDFENIYHNFGFDQAFSKDTASLSYALALNDKTWLISIDSNRYKDYTSGTISSGRVLPATEEWVLSLLKQAKDRNVTVFGMMHHGLVEHIMYQSLFFPSYLVDDWSRLSELFAKNGMKVIFTGHFHANDITESSTESKIYDVETGSLSSFPFPYRKMTWDGNVLDIHTFNVRSIPGKINLAEQDSVAKLHFSIESAKAKLKSKFSEMPDSTLDAMAQLIGKIFIMHVRGDEKMDEDLRSKIARFSSLMGGGAEMDLSDLQLDFPPADNDVTIRLK